MDTEPIIFATGDIERRRNWRSAAICVPSCATYGDQRGGRAVWKGKQIAISQPNKKLR
jgi:hypothetical protein